MEWMWMIILADKGQEQKILNQEKNEWVRNILFALNLPNEIFNLNNEQFKEYLDNHEIEIWSYYNGYLDIYKQNKIIAQWKDVKFILIKNNKNPKKSYYEIHVNEWAQPLQKLEI